MKVGLGPNEGCSAKEKKIFLWFSYECWIHVKIRGQWRITVPIASKWVKKCPVFKGTQVFRQVCHWTLSWDGEHPISLRYVVISSHLRPRFANCLFLVLSCDWHFVSFCHLPRLHPVSLMSRYTPLHFTFTQLQPTFSLSGESSGVRYYFW
jgi:hypothetical protein